ncbi:putative photosynthetic complex assembly protein PuhE [Qipengyuania sp. DGS5-3]|uniref:putative photosynthetic complex assembly protein PuhE n=1 Tax=Qipengyuania sp. DGS5-3 TaxID=3349632 RepID=UPI0036D3A1A8
MVEIFDLGLPFAVVVALWFVSTGLVAMINHRMRQSLGRALIISGICAIVGLSLIALTSNAAATWAVYASFLGGLLIWSWHEISFLTGAVAGSHRAPCPADAVGWRRFSAATMALIHHEIALAMTAGLLLSLAAFTINPTGAYAFALLLVFRLSSKLNIYWGVPNMSDELLPKHLEYLKSYFGPKRLSPILPLSIAAIGGLALYFANGASSAATSAEMVQNALLCCLCSLAALEHIFLAIPFRDSALWQWALDGSADRTEG